MWDSNRIRLATIATTIWASFFVVVLYQHWESFNAPGTIGDFLAGFTAPLAFLWLVVGYFQQQEEIRQNTEALIQQVAETQRLIEQQRRFSQPSFKLDVYSQKIGEDNFNYAVAISNKGETVHIIEVTCNYAFSEFGIIVNTENLPRVLESGAQGEISFNNVPKSSPDFRGLYFSVNYYDRSGLPAAQRYVMQDDYLSFQGLVLFNDLWERDLYQ